MTVVLLLIVLEYFGIRRLFGTLQRFDVGWFVFAVTVAVAQVYLSAWRWRLLFRAMTENVPRFRDLVLGVARSLVVGQLLPAGIGADAVRAASLSRAIGFPVAARSVICDRLLGLFVLLLTVTVELPLLAVMVTSGVAVISLATATLVAISAFAAASGFRRQFHRIPFVGQLFGTVADDFSLAFVHPSGRLAFAAGILGHLSSVVLFAAVVRSIDPAMSLRLSALVILPVLLVMCIPISLGGWGLREAAIVSGFSLLGADPLPAVAGSILFGISIVVGGAVTELGVSLFWPKRAIS